MKEYTKTLITNNEQFYYISFFPVQCAKFMFHELKDEISMFCVT